MSEEINVTPEKASEPDQPITPEQAMKARIAAAPTDEEVGAARDILARAQAAEEARIAAGPTDEQIAQADEDLRQARERQAAAAVDVRGSAPLPVDNSHTHAELHSHGDA